MRHYNNTLLSDKTTPYYWFEEGKATVQADFSGHSFHCYMRDHKIENGHQLFEPTENRQVNDIKEIFYNNLVWLKFRQISRKKCYVKGSIDSNVENS